MGKAAMITVLGAFVIFFFVNKNINTKLGTAVNYSIDFFSKLQARNVANSTAEMLLSVLGDSASFRKTNPATLSGFWGGTAEYTVTDTVLDSDSLIKIQVTGDYFNRSQKITVFTFVPKKSTLGFQPLSIKAAITTNNPVNTLGTLVVDGRNHDSDGNLIPGTGTKGIWTTSSFERKGASRIGGTDEGTDYEPVKTYPDSVVAENQSFPGGFPLTPDSVLGGSPNGYPPGKLKTIAKSGASGSQYVTDPADLNHPLSGVTFVELPAGGVWNSANVKGEGILIVHNSNLDAVIKNLNTGPFEGILIADDIVHIHCDIIGAVVVLSSSPSSGNCIGNGNGKILYSSQAISGATENSIPSFEGRHGFNRRRMPVVHWAE